jgi:hypothetical protein
VDAGSEVDRWNAIAQAMAAGGTPAGWAELCKKAGSSAGPDRTAKPEPGALACSSDAAVTELQRFAVQLLAAQAEAKLWQRGATGHDDGSLAARLSEVRNSCVNGLPARQGGAESAYGKACALALDGLTTPLDAADLFDSLGQAYSLVAADLAERDATIDAEPAGTKAASSTPAASS